MGNSVCLSVAQIFPQSNENDTFFLDWVSLGKNLFLSSIRPTHLEGTDSV